MILKFSGSCGYSHTSLSSAVSLSLSCRSVSPASPSLVGENSRPSPTSGVLSTCDDSRPPDWQKCAVLEESELATASTTLMFSIWLWLRSLESESTLSCDWLRDVDVITSSASAFWRFSLRRWTSADSSWECVCSLERSWGESERCKRRLQDYNLWKVKQHVRRKK